MVPARPPGIPPFLWPLLRRGLAFQAQARPDADKVIIEGMTHLLKQSEVTDPQRQKTTIYMDAAAPVSEKLVSVMAGFIRRV